MLKIKNILITGASGLIGSALAPALTARGYTVRTLSRHHGDFNWNPATGYIDAQALNGIDCVINLAGEPIAQRWTSAAKKRIFQSRVQSAQLLLREISRHRRKLKFICASGINYYGSNVSEPVTEHSEAGSGFLANLCVEWEGAVLKCESDAVREHASFIRTGIVLSPKGGALKQMLIPFKAGVGGRIGTGSQMMSWISLEDIVNVYIQTVEDQSLTGAVNAVTPNPVSNKEFTKTLGQILRRPTILPLPACIVKIIFGEMARETILANLNVLPQKLLQCGFTWRDPELSKALNTLLK